MDQDGDKSVFTSEILGFSSLLSHKGYSKLELLCCLIPVSSFDIASQSMHFRPNLSSRWPSAQTSECHCLAPVGQRPSLSSPQASADVNWQRGHVLALLPNISIVRVN